MPSYVQSNTQTGQIVRLTNDTVAEGRLVKLVDAIGEAHVAYPTADGDPCQFVTAESASSGELVTLIPLVSGANIRIVSSGTIAGAKAVIAENATGKIKAGSAANTFNIGFTEEDAASGNYTPCAPRFT
jgi:hypothetical protein